MYLHCQKIPQLLLISVLAITITLVGCYHHNAVAQEISIKGSICHVYLPNGSHTTYIDIVIGQSFLGALPSAIDSIIITGPSGNLPVGKNDFKYNPQSKAFWIFLPGFPETGEYSFKILSGHSSGSDTDIQTAVKTIPIPDVSKFEPEIAQNVFCSSPTFSWASLNESDSLFYQLQIKEFNRRHIYRTSFVRDMVSVRIPQNLLIPGRTYQWRIRVADGPDWVMLNNRSQSRWVTFSNSQNLKPCKYQYTIPPIEDNGFSVSTLKAEGINSDIINKLIMDILNQNIQDIHSVLIVKNGKLVLEEYFDGHSRHKTHSMMSVSKSITSILIGIGRDQNKIPNADTNIYKLFPTYQDVNWNNMKKAIQLKHVLNMTAGIDWNDIDYPDTDPRSTTQAMVHSDDWTKFILSRKSIASPGDNFVYSNGLTILLGEILKQSTGEPADRFAGKYLFQPMGIKDYSWDKLPDGTIVTAWGLYLRPYDMAKIGYMMLRGGKWNNKQVVSSKWVNESTKTHVKGDLIVGSGYGYQWWRGDTFIDKKNIEVFYAAGKGGQYIFVCPELDLVTIFTSKDLDNPNGELPPQLIMANYIIPSMVPETPSQNTFELDTDLIEAYVGIYEYKKLKIQLTMFRDGDKLFYKTKHEIGALFPEKENLFSGNSKVLGDFKVAFSKNDMGEASQFLVRFGFRAWQFEKLEN